MARRRHLSPRAYAAHRKCALSTVQEALKSGRLRKSARKVKGAWLIDPVAADREWGLATHADRAPLTGPTAPRARDDEEEDENPLVEARARHEMAKAELAELELAEALGKVVKAADVEAARTAEIKRCKNLLQGIPSKLRQDDPSFTAAQLARVEERIREALEELADREEAAAA